MSIGTFEVGLRTGGSITGSRVAGACGRIPVEESLRHEAPTLIQHGWRFGYHIFAAAAFVDNLFFASPSLGGSLLMADAVERRLRTRWRLRIKPTSRVAMPVAGSPEHFDLQATSTEWPQWSFSDSFRVLGMLLDNRGAMLNDFREVHRAVISAMMLNFGSHVCRATCEASKLRLIDRVARTVFDYRNTRWPASPVLARSSDALQRRCISIACGPPRRPGEDLDVWQRRRSRHAGEVARQRGLWSERHLLRLYDWRMHVLRSERHGSLMAPLWKWKNADWREQQRQRAGSARVVAGRLSSRVLTHVYTRWEDSLNCTRL